MPALSRRATAVRLRLDSEIKHDGYRLMARRDGAGIRLLTRNGHDWSERYPLIVEAVDRALLLGRARVLLLDLTTSIARPFHASLGSE